MFLSLVYTELLKYKRSIIPWMIVIGGSLPAVVSLLSVSTENSQFSWELLASRGLSFMNLLALLLVAVFTGYVFVGEYHGSNISILFTYPVSKYKFYVVKYFVVLFFVIFLYLIFFLSILFFGFINIEDFASKSFLLKFIKLTFLMVATNFVLVPFTALISIIIKGIGTFLLVGMGYFLTYISFIASSYSLFIPTCIPDKLVANYFVSEYLIKADFIGIVIVSSVTFLSAFFIGAVCYSKSDVYE